MSNVELVSFPDEQALAETVAEQWLSQLKARSLQPSFPFCVALSGGRIAKRFLEAVARPPDSNNSDWSSVHFFWSDERCVPADDPESNFGLAHDLLLAPLKIAKAQIHRVRGEDPPAMAAAEAEAELRRIVPVEPGGQQPLDLVFLGMGEDGHVASLFPGESEELMASETVYRPVIAVKPPPHRVTMSYATISAARQTWVLASGAGKEAALRESLDPGGRTPLDGF